MVVNQQSRYAVSARTAIVIDERPGADGAPVPVEGNDVAWLSLELASGGYGNC
jgi:hypothetical protein